MFLDLKSCCGVMSVKTGSFFIAIFNQVFAVFSFIGHVSAAVIVLREFSYLRLYVLMVVAFGTLVSAVHMVMGGILFNGLQKENPVHLRRYLIIGPVVVTLSLLLLGGSSFLLHWSLAIPSVLGMAAQIYFMLVIRTAYKEMILIERK